jgi:hypothetical protein
MNNIQQLIDEEEELAQQVQNHCNKVEANIAIYTKFIEIIGPIEEKYKLLATKEATLRSYSSMTR